MNGGKGSPAMGCAILLALLAGGLFVLWACALGKERTEPDGFCAWGERRGV